MYRQGVAPGAGVSHAAFETPQASEQQAPGVVNGVGVTVGVRVGVLVTVGVFVGV